SIKIGVVHDNYVYLIGSDVLRVNKVTGKADSWKPVFDEYDHVGVSTIAIHGNSVYLGGAFELWIEDSQHWLAVVRANINTGIISGWQPSLSIGEGGAEALVVTETKLLVAGDIHYETNGIEKSYYAEFLLPDDPADEIGNINIYNAVSPNGDGMNEIFVIQNIGLLPDTQNNRVTIFNRWGDVVFEISNYNNDDRSFTGLNKSGNALPPGTYFYRIEFSGGRKTQTGYLSLKR
ncbi:MAG TPA: gliding motility-associated C-terminal domain-containing protein, partial [Cyclobacteriaceae bacterium]|nr:gliding motility-associated C-terminal domain-containing protein [Cyclobacteriaceae bacterium]